MKKREIIKSLLAGEIPERVGIFEQFWPFICENAWAEQGVPVGTDFVTRFNLDMRHVSWGPVPGPRPDLVRTIDETDEWKLAQDAWGAQVKLWKHKSGTPEHCAYYMTTPDIWYKEFRDAVLATDMHTAFDLPKVRADYAKGKAAGEFVLFAAFLVFEDLRRILGDVVMLESVLLEPKWIHDFNQVMTRKTMEGFEILFREVGLPDGVHLFDDLAYTQSVFVSPACHRELVLSYHKQVVGFLKAHHLPVILHTCGDFRPHLPSIIEAGFDCIQAMEAKTGMNVVTLAEQYKDKLCFMGNLDIRAFESGDRARIKEECLGKLNGMKRLRAPYIFMSDHSIPPTVKVSDYDYVQQLFRDNCRYS